MQGAGTVVSSLKSWSLIEGTIYPILLFPTWCCLLFMWTVWSMCVHCSFRSGVRIYNHLLLVSPIIAIHVIINLNNHGAWLFKDTTLQGTQI